MGRGPAMDDQLLRQLNQRLDEHHAHLRERLDDLRREMQTLYGTIVARLDAHETYHRQCEHRWGLPRLAQRHPFRLALIAFSVAWLMAAAAPESLQWLTRLALDWLRSLRG